ncbi:hypothetical protein [Bifidobacterium erythrocebi]|nr:hypothetical protein [Bifidobacterium sp. DSM 109960]
MRRKEHTGQRFGIIAMLIAITLGVGGFAMMHPKSEASLPINNMELVQVTEIPDRPPNIIASSRTFAAVSYAWKRNGKTETHTPDEGSGIPDSHHADLQTLRQQLHIDNAVHLIGVFYWYYRSILPNGIPGDPSEVMQCTYRRSNCMIQPDESSIGLQLRIPDDAKAITITAHYGNPSSDDVGESIVSWAFRVDE